MSDIFEPKLLTTRQVAHVLNTSTRFVEERVRTGELPSVRLGKLRRIHEDVVLDLQKFGLTGERHFRPRSEDE
jgi:excisionase family DNA binding protein